MKKLGITAAAIALMLSTTACSTTAENQTMTAGGIVIDDSLEEANRGIYKFNTAVDNAVFHPLVKGYQAVVPKPARTGVRNFLENLKAPMKIANNLLQGDVSDGLDTTFRTIINTTVGIGGLIDVAKTGGLENENEDFGQTLGVWGVGHGPYLMVPLLGPTTLRDGVGRGVDGYLDPLSRYWDNIDEEHWGYTRMAADYFQLKVNLMPILEDIQNSAIDSYATLRAGYYQNREAEIKEQDSYDAPDLSFDDFDEDF